MFEVYIKKGQLDKLEKEIEKLTVAEKPKNIAKIVLEYDKKLKKWEEKLIEKLSDYLPKKYWHKKRNPFRWFPHKNTGNLIKSIKSKTETKQTNKITTIHSWVEIGVPYAVYLNEAKPPRDDGLIPNWEGFADDLFFTHKGRQGLVSVLDLFDELIDNLMLKVE